MHKIKVGKNGLRAVWFGPRTMFFDIGDRVPAFEAPVVTRIVGLNVLVKSGNQDASALLRSNFPAVDGWAVIKVRENAMSSIRLALNSVS